MNTLTAFLNTQEQLNQAEAKLFNLRQTLEDDPYNNGCPYRIGEEFEKSGKRYHIEKIRVHRTGKQHYWIAYGRHSDGITRASISTTVK